MLGSHKAAADLLRKRSRNYSSCPHMIVAGDSITRNNLLALMPYGERWRTHRQILTFFLSTDMIKQYQRLQSIKRKELAHKFWSSNDFVRCFNFYATSTAFALIYGKHQTAENESEVQKIEEVIEMTVMALLRIPNLLVEVFPFLDYLPQKLTPWRRMGDKVYAKAVELFTKNFDEARRRKAWNWTKTGIKTKEAQSLPKEELAYLFSHLYEGSTDTVTACLEVFVLVSVLHPDAVRRVQQELDAVVGQERLLSFEDMPKLPYLNGFVKEVLRWRPIVPARRPHCAIEADNYMGYHTPKGAIVLPSHWSMEFDDEAFERPSEFRPERWLENSNLPLRAFGFGLQTCPGEVIGQQSLFIVISQLLWTFEISLDRENVKSLDTGPLAMSPKIHLQASAFQSIFPSSQLETSAHCRNRVGDFRKDIDSVLESITESVRH